MGLVALPGGSAVDPALIGAQAAQDFEQELVDQYALAMSAAGLTDRHIGGTRAIVIEFARSLSTPLWEATCADADAFLAQQRRMGLSVSTRAGTAGALACVSGDTGGTVRRRASIAPACSTPRPINWAIFAVAP